MELRNTARITGQCYTTKMLLKVLNPTKTKQTMQILMLNLKVTVGNAVMQIQKLSKDQCF